MVVETKENIQKQLDQSAKNLQAIRLAKEKERDIKSLQEPNSQVQAIVDLQRR